MPSSYAGAPSAAGHQLGQDSPAICDSPGDLRSSQIEAERYGLFTIILLGESVLAASRGVTGALEAAEISIRLVVVAVSGLVLLFAFWWLYFLAPVGVGLDDRRHRSYLWGYGHYGIFAALAALGAGLEVTVEWTGHDLRASGQVVCYAIAIPAAVFLLLLWLVNAPITAEPVVDPAAVLGGVGVILVLPLATARLGVAAVVAAIAAVNVLLIISALAGKSGRSAGGGRRRRSYLSQKR